MIDKATREKIISLIHREVVPALGCTEPIAVSLAVAKATELLGMQPEEINLGLSGNIIKNAMGVGIPGTGMIGLPIAIALGSLIGKSEYGLEVLKEVSPEAVERGKSFIESVPINIKHLPDSLTFMLTLRSELKAILLEPLFHESTRSLSSWKKTVRRFMWKKMVQETVMLKTQMTCS